MLRQQFDSIAACHGLNGLAPVNLENALFFFHYINRTGGHSRHL